MLLKNLRIHNFRNHLNSYFEFGDRTNIIFGENGHGKTSVIEAITYLCLTKSFYALNDKIVVSKGSDLFEIEGEIKAGKDDTLRIRIAYSETQNEKLYSINQHRVTPFSSIIGKFPVVICAPEYGPITIGGPFERRKFIDFVISQSNSKYFQYLIEYRRVIKNRNKILIDGKTQKKEIASLLEPWNDQLVDKGSYLILMRKVFVEEFQQYMQMAYDKIVDRSEKTAIEYKPALHSNFSISEDEIHALLQEELKQSIKEEQKLGSTLIGPHRDELVFKINDLDLRKYASQGQHKTFLVALKIAEFFYLKERCYEIPILLLDDIFSELDEKRSERLLEFIETLSQTFITAVSPNLFINNIISNNNNRNFYIKEGSITDQKSFAA